MDSVKGLKIVVPAVLLTIVTLLVVACAAPALTPTPTPKPAVAAPTPKPAAPTPTKVPEAIRFEVGKFQPLPDGFPNKAITMVAIGSPGGGSDIFIRTIQKVAQPFSPVPIVAENKAGGSGWVGLTFVIEQGSTEGYHVVQFSTGPQNASHLAPTPYTYKDLKPVLNIMTDPQVLMVRADDARFKTFDEFIAWGKANPDKLKWSAGSPGTIDNMLAFAISKAIGAKPTVLNFAGGGEAAVALLGAEVDAYFGTSAETAEQVVAGKFRPLATSNPVRLKNYPNIPTLKEKGFDLIFTQYRGLFTNPKVSDLHVQWLDALYKKAMETPEFQKWITDGGAESLYMAPKEWLPFIVDYDKRVETITKELGIHKSQKK